MAEVKQATVPLPLNPHPNYAPLMQELANLGQAINTDAIERKATAAAEDIASVAEGYRQFAEQNVDYGPGTGGVRAGHRAMGALDPNLVLSERAQQIEGLAQQRIDRYRKALEQGAGNASAARIAMQKEMKDLISQYPGYAQIVRQKTAEAMGMEEFAVRTADLPTLAAGSGSDYKTEFQKFAMDIDEQAQYRVATGAMTPQQAQSWADQNKQDYITRTQLEREVESLGAIENLGFRGIQSWITSEVSNVEAKYQQAADQIILGLGEGQVIPESVQQNLVLGIDQDIMRLSSLLNSRVSGTNFSPDQRAQLEGQIGRLNQWKDVIRESSWSELQQQRLAALDAGIKLTAYESHSHVLLAKEIGGSENLQYIIKGMYQPDSPLSQHILRNSPYFQTIMDSLPDSMSSEEKGRAIMNSQFSALKKFLDGNLDGQGIAPFLAQQVDRIAQLPEQARENAPLWQKTFDIATLNSDPATQSVATSTIRGMPEADPRQVRAVERVFLPNWERAKKEHINRPLRSYFYSEGQPKSDARWFVVEVDSNGLPEVVQYQREMAPAVSLGYSQTVPGGTQSRREVVSRRVIGDLTDRYRHLFMSEDTPRGRRSVAEVPGINDRFFDNLDNATIIRREMMELNGVEDVNFVPDWVRRSLQQ